jgi:hypothetical protein
VVRGDPENLERAKGFDRYSGRGTAQALARLGAFHALTLYKKVSAGSRLQILLVLPRFGICGKLPFIDQF